jgi:hypothetical protein
LTTLTAVPLELPVRASDAAALAGIVFQLADGRQTLRDDVRNRIAARIAGEQYETLRVFPGSLAQDPVNAAAYFIAVDAGTAGATAPLLLRLALSSAPASALFPNATLITRTRSGDNQEFVIGAIPFSPSNHNEIRLFVEEVDRGFMPRPHGAQSAWAVAPEDPDAALPAAFQAYRQILRNSGQNVAAVVSAGHDAEHLLDAALWAAIRCGWREGFSAGVQVPLEGGLEAARTLIRQCQRYTRFSVLARRGDLDQLEMCVQLHAYISELKSTQRPWKQFDFELSLAGSGISSLDDVVYCLESLKRRGCAAQSVAPDLSRIGNSTEFDLRVAALAEAVRPLNAALTLQGPFRRLKSLSPGTRVNYEFPVSSTAEPSEIINGILEIGENLRG